MDKLLQDLLILDPENISKAHGCFCFKVPGYDFIVIPEKPRSLENRAVIAEVVRIWITHRGWKMWHTPIGQTEHSIGISIGESQQFSSVSSSYVHALVSAYIKALTDGKYEQTQQDFQKPTLSILSLGEK